MEGREAHRLLMEKLCLHTQQLEAHRLYSQSRRPQLSHYPLELLNRSGQSTGHTLRSDCHRFDWPDCSIESSIRQQAIPVSLVPFDAALSEHEYFNAGVSERKNIWADLNQILRSMHDYAARRTPTRIYYFSGENFEILAYEEDSLIYDTFAMLYGDCSDVREGYDHTKSRKTSRSLTCCKRNVLWELIPSIFQQAMHLTCIPKTNRPPGDSPIHSTVCWRSEDGSIRAASMLLFIYGVVEVMDSNDHVEAGQACRRRFGKVTRFTIDDFRPVIEPMD